MYTYYPGRHPILVLFSHSSFRLHVLPLLSLRHGSNCISTTYLVRALVHICSGAVEVTPPGSRRPPTHRSARPIPASHRQHLPITARSLTRSRILLPFSFLFSSSFSFSPSSKSTSLAHYHFSFLLFMLNLTRCMPRQLMFSPIPPLSSLCSLQRRQSVCIVRGWTGL